MFSIRQYLEETFQVRVRSGQKAQCPYCQHQTLSLKGDELAKCFHSSCGRFINAASVESGGHFLQQFLWEVMAHCHTALVSQEGVSGKFGGSAWRYLKERRIHPRVILECPVLGIVSADLEFESMVAPIRERLEGERGDKRHAERLDAFNAAVESLEERLAACRNWLVFGYTDASGQLTGFRFREPFSKRFQAEKFSDAFRGVFNPFLFDFESKSPWPYVLLAEGEFNILRLQSLLCENNLTCCRALALGGSSSVDWKTLKALPDEWVLFQDHDEAGRILAEQMARQATCRVVSSPHYDDDLDSYINRFSTPQEALNRIQELLGQADYRYRPYEAIFEEVNAIREHAGDARQKDFLTKQAVSTLLRNEFVRRGAFYHAGRVGYFLDRASKTLIPLQSGVAALQQLLHACGLNPEEPIHKFALREMEKYARDHGEETTVQRFVHYDPTQHTLYLHNRDTEIFRVTPSRIEVVENGTDGILFETLPRYVPFERVDITVGHDYLHELLLRSIRFDSDILGEDDYCLLLETWIFSLFFPALMATRPIPAFIGPKGSAKTSTLRRLGILLFGSNFQVASMPEKPDDFDAVVTNSFLAVFDNVDNQVAWLNDRLAIAATGGSIQKRELYTTNQLVEFTIRAHVAITSRTPRFRRDDVAERLLIFQLQVLTQKVSEKRLIDEALAARNAFMSWLLIQLQGLLQALEQTRDTPAVETELRMADFATFLIRLARAEGESVEQHANDILSRLVTIQSRFTLEQDPLFSLLALVADEHPDQPFTASELHKVLKDLSKSSGSAYGYSSHASLAQKLSQLKPNISQFLEMRIETGRANRQTYRFGPKEGLLTTSNHLLTRQKALL